MSIFRSVRARFTGWYLVVLAVLLIAMCVGVYAALRHTLATSLDRALAHRLEEVMAQPDFIRMITVDPPRAPLGEVNGAYILSEEGWTAIGYQLSNDTIPTGRIGCRCIDLRDDGSRRRTSGPLPSCRLGAAIFADSPPRSGDPGVVPSSRNATASRY